MPATTPDNITHEQNIKEQLSSIFLLLLNNRNKNVPANINIFNVCLRASGKKYGLKTAKNNAYEITL